MRVQSIIRELRGEKIDIIEYSDEPVVFATHALSPAKISRVLIIDPLGKHMEVIVNDSQLRWRLGRRGRMCGSPPNCLAGESISRVKRRSGRR